MAERNLRFVIDGVTDGAQKAMDEVSNKAERLGGRMKAVGERTSAMGTSLTKKVTGPALAVAGAMAGAAMKTANYGDRVAKAARKSGMGAEAFQELEYALGQAGLSSQDTEKTLGRLNQRIGLAAEGNKKYGKAFDALGVSVKDANGNIRGSDEVLNDVFASLGEVSDETTRSALASELFGTKLSRELMPALEGGAEGLEEARQRARDMGIVMSGESAAASEKFNDSLDNMKRQVMGVVMGVGSDLLPLFTDHLVPTFQDNVVPAIEAVIGLVKQVVDWFGRLPGPVQKVVGVMAALAVAIGPVLIVVGKVITIMGSLVAAYAKVKKAMIALKVAAMANPWVLLIAATVALVILIVKNWDKITAAVRKALDWISKKIRQVGDWISRTWAALWDGVVSDLRRAKQWIIDTWNRAVAAVRNALSRAKQWIINTWNNLWNSAKRIVRSGIDAVLRFVRSLKTRAIQAVQELARRWLAGARKLAIEFPAAIARMVGKVITAVVRFGVKIHTTIREAFAKFLTAAKDKAGELISYVAGLPGRLVRALGDLGGVLKRAGRRLIGGLIEGITEKFRAVKRKLGELTSKLPSWKGPPGRDKKLLRGSGQLIMKGLVDGIDNGTRRVRRKLGEVSDMVAGTEFGADGSLALRSRGGGIGSAGHGRRTVDVKVYLDGRVIAQAISEPLADEIRVRTGTRL